MVPGLTQLRVLACRSMTRPRIDAPVASMGVSKNSNKSSVEEAHRPLCPGRCGCQMSPRGRHLEGVDVVKGSGSNHRIGGVDLVLGEVDEVDCTGMPAGALMMLPERVTAAEVGESGGGPPRERKDRPMC